MHELNALLMARDPASRKALLAQLPLDLVEDIYDHWPRRAHRGQLSPEGDWRTWVIMAGRGFGKTRAGAEWVLNVVRAGTSPNPPAIALVAATHDEARAVMVEGPSGLLRLAREGEIENWSPTNRRLRFAGGAEAFLYSGASPDKLRGPEHSHAWCDELAKWRKAKETWDNLQLGLRVGDHPRAIVTTTPRAGEVLRAIRDAPDTVQTNGGTRENPHLARSVVEAYERSYGGTRLGAQELDGVLLDDVEGSLWPRELIEACRLEPTSAPPLRRIVIGVDPPASVGGTCGIVVAGLGIDEAAYVMADESVSGRSPEGWARAVADAAARHRADRIIVEKNQGGDMVSSVLRAACATLPLETVHAHHGKTVRAEPVATLFEGGRAFLAGVFPELEAQLTGLTTGGRYDGPGTSPDRADACVWALWALLLKPARSVAGFRVL